MAYIGANVFVTGANRGIGFGLVKQMLEHSEVKRVFAGTRKPDESKELQELAEANSKVQIVQYDSLSDKSIHAAVDVVTKAVGGEGLNTLIHNGGVFHSDGNDSKNPDRDSALKVFNTNVVGIMVSSPAFLPLLNKAATAERPAKIVNVSSGAGSIEKLNGDGFPHSNSTYPASKSALNSYTKFFATAEYSKNVIAVAMCPGWVKTDMGGQRASLTIEESTSAIVETLSQFKKSDSGRFIDRNGETIPH